MENIKQLTEFLLPLLKLVGLFTIAFIVLLGIFFKIGKERWVEEIEKYKKNNGQIIIKDFPTKKKKVFFWKNPDLLYSGSISFTIVCILSLYMLFTYIFSETKVVDFKYNLGILLSYPNSMMGGIIIVHSFYLKKFGFFKTLLSLVIAAALCAITTLLFSHFEVQNILIFQLCILLFLSLMISMILGITSAIEEMDIEKSYPKVELILVDGTQIQNLRFFEKSNIDYRFIKENGNVIVYPIKQIKEFSILN